jgi:hypothetical protein
MTVGKPKEGWAIFYVTVLSQSLFYQGGIEGGVKSIPVRLSPAELIE